MVAVSLVILLVFDNQNSNGNVGNQAVGTSPLLQSGLYLFAATSAAFILDANSAGLAGTGLLVMKINGASVTSFNLSELQRRAASSMVAGSKLVK
jgi:hypothetical protein